MVARITQDQLRKYVDAPADIDLQDYIDDASLIVDEKLGTANPPLSSGRLALIEKNIAAHFYVLSVEKGGLTLETMGKATNEYANPFKGAGLGSTRFGSMAISLDENGALGDLAQTKKRALFRVVESAPCNDGVIEP